jgi:hypothetical protein
VVITEADAIEMPQQDWNRKIAHPIVLDLHVNDVAASGLIPSA